MKGKAQRNPIIIKGINGKTYKKELTSEGLKSLTIKEIKPLKKDLVEDVKETEMEEVVIPEIQNPNVVIEPTITHEVIEPIQETTKQTKSSDKKLLFLGVGLGLAVLFLINQ